MTKHVVREFKWLSWRFGRQAADTEAIFHEEWVKAEIACDGPLLEAQGHIVALETMKAVMGPWLAKNWDKRLLLAGNEISFNRYCQRFTWPRAPYILPGKNDAEAMARYLLTEVAEIGLLGKGLRVMHVIVRRPCERPMMAFRGQKNSLQSQELEPDEIIFQTQVVFGEA